ncbi:MAG: alpha-2-macroglobulin family protein, partial [Planctomycetaceae bacterium]
LNLDVEQTQQMDAGGFYDPSPEAAPYGVPGPMSGDGRWDRYGVEMLPSGEKAELAENFRKFQMNSMPNGKFAYGFGEGFGGGFGGGGFGGQEQAEPHRRPPMRNAPAQKQQQSAGSVTKLNGQPQSWSARGDFNENASALLAAEDKRSSYWSSYDFRRGGATERLKELAAAKNPLFALNGRGELQVVNNAAVARLEDFAEDGMQLLPGASETGYWNPAVVTGADGKAQVTFQLPERSTAWSLRARGVNASTLTGEADAEIIAKKDLFGDIKTPLAFYEGDKSQVIVDVHNASVEAGEEIAVTLKWTIGDRTTELTRKLKSEGQGVQEVSFPVEITAGDNVEFHLTVSAGLVGEVETLSVPVLPFGLPVFATASGTSGQSTIALVEHDQRLAVEQPEMEILIGPSVNRALLDAVLGGASALSDRGWSPGSGTERAVSDVLGGVALLE